MTKKSVLGAPPRPREADAQLERLKAGATDRKVRLNVNVPAHLYERYKREVERMGLSVTAVVVQHMHAFLQERE